jgi:hypothetical protein
MMFHMRRLLDRILIVVAFVAGTVFAAPAMSALVLQGSFEGEPGGLLVISLVADEDLSVSSLDLNPPAFPAPFSLTAFDRSGLPLPQVACNDVFGICSFFGPPDLAIAANTVLATWTLKIADDALLGAEQPVDFGVTLNDDDLDSADLGVGEEATLRVVENQIPEVPEPSAYLTLGIGLALIVGFLGRRRAVPRTAT